MSELLETISVDLNGSIAVVARCILIVTKMLIFPRRTIMLHCLFGTFIIWSICLYLHSFLLSRNLRSLVFNRHWQLLSWIHWGRSCISLCNPITLELFCLCTISLHLSLCQGSRNWHGKVGYASPTSNSDSRLVFNVVVELFRRHFVDFFSSQLTFLILSFPIALLLGRRRSCLILVWNSRICSKLLLVLLLRLRLHLLLVVILLKLILLHLLLLLLHLLLLVLLLILLLIHSILRVGRGRLTGGRPLLLGWRLICQLLLLLFLLH